jgi:hypothetical protein
LLDATLSPEIIRTLAYGILGVVQESTADEPLHPLKLLCHQILDFQMV